MTTIWLNGTIGAGKNAVGRALAEMLPRAVFVDGDDVAPAGVTGPARWRMAVDALARRVARRNGRETLVVAYPLTQPDFARVRAACGRAGRRLIVVNLATPLPIVLRRRGGRRLDLGEVQRVREMCSEGYRRRRFAALTLPNAQPPARLTARRIAAVFVLISFSLVFTDIYRIANRVRRDRFRFRSAFRNRYVRPIKTLRLPRLSGGGWCA